MVAGRLSMSLELLDEQLAVAPEDRRRDFARPVHTSGEQRERGHSDKLGTPADREPVRGGNADPDSGEAAGSDADEDASRLRPSSSSASIGTSRSLCPRPICSSLRREADPAVIKQRGGAGGTRSVEG